MLIQSNYPVVEGFTSFKRKAPERRKAVHEGGSLHMESIFASGGMVVSIFHNYKTNKEEISTMTIQTALERYKGMVEMRRNSPEWVSEEMLPAILKAIRAAQRQTNEMRGVITDMGDPSLDDIEKECGVIEGMLAKARAADPELDAEMTAIENKFMAGVRAAKSAGRRKSLTARKRRKKNKA